MASLDENTEELLWAFRDIVPPQPTDRHVHITSAECRFPASGNGLWGAGMAWLHCVDSFLEMPRARWDIDVYYSSEAGQFGHLGKSSTKHAGLIDDQVMMEFDNNFFGFSDKQAVLMPPTTRLLFECAYKCLSNVGYNRETLKGAKIALSVADIGQEWGSFNGLLPEHEHNCFPYEPELWALSTHMHSINSPAQVAINFGLVGPIRNVDTACSASLVAASINHAALRKSDPNYDATEAMSMGHQGCFSPFTFIGLSGAGMLGRCGRSLTFDASANGYNRGEGVGGLLQRISGDPDETIDRLGYYVSSFINQDGRSASLTAPNGPSQQAVMRNSMQLENLAVEDIIIQECHGTGTALGDPIEVGSVRAVFRKHPTGLPITSGKTHLGHLESTAGSVGLLKTLVSLLLMAEPPNVHLCELNAHIEIAGFPGLFPTEITDLRADYAIGGLNGFGFGGTNCRSELMAKCIRGPRAPSTRSVKQLRLAAQPWEVRGRTELLDALDAAAAECLSCQGRSVSVLGSWTAWDRLEEMRPQPGGLFAGEVCLGEACCEEFRLVVDGDREQVIVPVFSKADQNAPIVGPGSSWRGKSWLIDGRADGLPPGTIYQIIFEWTDEAKSIVWRPMEQ